MLRSTASASSSALAASSLAASLSRRSPALACALHDGGRPSNVARRSGAQPRICLSRSSEALSGSLASRSLARTITGSIRYASTSSSTQSSTPQTPLGSPEGVVEKFQRLGLNSRISKQIAATHPHIRAPTTAQAALIPAILSPADLILRAHTGTGKSFGILLALLAKPRIVFRDSEAQPSGARMDKSKGKGKAPDSGKGSDTGIASIIIVPSNELAAQYMRWVNTLFPKSVLPTLDPVIQCLVRGSDNGLTPEEEQAKLRHTPPHILVGTPGRIKDILDTPSGASLLGIDTLRTVVLDEADAILQLPGRFPGQKQRWKHQVHRAPGLDVLNAIMKKRPTFSGGERHMSAGLENRPGKRKDERRPPEFIRRQAYRAAENPDTGLALPRRRTGATQPLQLVCASATANSVMRHFFGARTGWLRTGAREAETRVAGGIGHGRGTNAHSGRWIDLTGLSGSSMTDAGIRSLVRDTAATSADFAELVDARPASLPPGIEHTCVVVDEAPLSRKLDRFPLRNLDTILAKRRPDKNFLNDGRDEALSAPAPDKFVGEDDDEASDPGLDYKVVMPPGDPAEHEMDEKLIEALAFCFASEGVEKGLALIPPRWSLFKTRAAFESLGLSVRFAGEETPATIVGSSGDEASEVEPHLYLLQSTSARGLDLPGLTHVFLLGYHAVIDAVQYTHMAGRVARVGIHSQPRTTTTTTTTAEGNDATTLLGPRGKVVTLLRGIPHDYTEDVPERDPRLPPSSKKVEEEQAVEGAKRWISKWEQKMGAVYRRLGLVPRKLDLTLLDQRARKQVGSDVDVVAVETDGGDGGADQSPAAVEVKEAEEAVEMAGSTSAEEAEEARSGADDDVTPASSQPAQAETEDGATPSAPVSGSCSNTTSSA